MRSHENDPSINRSLLDRDESSFTAYKFPLIARDSLGLSTKKCVHGVYTGLQFSCQFGLARIHYMQKQK